MLEEALENQEAVLNSIHLSVFLSEGARTDHVEANNVSCRLPWNIPEAVQAVVRNELDSERVTRHMDDNRRTCIAR
jgi:hypothetical protein